MLIGINPILSPDMLHALRSMGHTDEIAIVDGNYPALSDAKRLIRADGHHSAALLEAILDIMPVEDGLEDAVFIPHTDKPQPIHGQFKLIFEKRLPKIKVKALVGDAFYNRVRGAYAIIASSEPALYGNIVIRKGVIYPR
jgi:L-fucose mutarotase